MQIRTRIITALVLIPAVIALVVYLPPPWFAGASALLVLLAAWEWTRIAGFTHRAAIAGYVGAVGAAIALCYLWREGPLPGILTAAALLWWCAALGLVVAFHAGHSGWTANPFMRAAAGFLVLVPAWLSLVTLGRGDGVSLLLFLLILVWIADSVAFFTGRRWGRTRLSSVVSPGKSWEGVYGALAATLAASLVYVMLQNMNLSAALAFLVVCLVTVIGSVLGDLVESMMKRVARLKDSSGLIPGHGGVLDRIDSLTAAAPIFLAGVWITGLPL